MTNCAHCGKDTANPKFCSSSCSTCHNNKLFPKRKPEGKCYVCGTPIKASRKYCKTCRVSESNPGFVDWSKTLISDLTEKRRYQVNSRIRELARQTYSKSLRKKGCVFCDFRYFEVHHIKSIDSFDKSTPITEVNHIDNLIGLCPNHHWEADNGLIDENTLRLHRI